MRAALDMLDLVDEFNREQTRRGGVEIRIGIGIAAGPLNAGFTGTQERVTYTCVGDTVNLAAHLEAHTKILGQPILIDEHTRAGLGDAIRVEDRGPAQFKSRARSVRVFSIPPGQRRLPGVGYLTEIRSRPGVEPTEQIAHTFPVTT